MMDEERRSVPPAPGASALLVIFAVLCLTVLAMLSLSTVQADARLSDASAEAVAGYYACPAAGGNSSFGRSGRSGRILL